MPSDLYYLAFAILGVGWAVIFISYVAYFLSDRSDLEAEELSHKQAKAQMLQDIRMRAKGRYGRAITWGMRLVFLGIVLWFLAGG